MKTIYYKFHPLCIYVARLKREKARGRGARSRLDRVAPARVYCPRYPGRALFPTHLIPVFPDTPFPYLQQRYPDVQKNHQVLHGHHIRDHHVGGRRRHAAGMAVAGQQAWAPAVTSKSGIGTANASAEVKVTR